MREFGEERFEGRRLLPFVVFEGEAGGRRGEGWWGMWEIWVLDIICRPVL